MNKISKISLLSVSLAIFISSCNSDFSNTNLNAIKTSDQLQVDQQEFSTFASQTANVLLLEQDSNKDNVVTKDDAQLSNTEMAQIDKNSDGVLTKDEVATDLQKEFNNAAKIAEAVQDTPAAQLPTGSEAQIYNGTLPLRLPSSSFKTNKVQLFIDREEILPMMLEEIKNAKKSIQMDVYLLGGAIGLQVAQELVNKYRSGVDIKLTMDPSLGFAGPTQKEVYNVINYLQKSHVDFRLYPLHLMPKETDGILRNKFQIDHNKLYVIDGTTFITGGFNLFDVGVINRDLMLKIQGPTAQEASDLMMYEWTLGDKYIAPKPPKEAFVIKAESPEDAQVKIVKTAPNERTTKDALIEMIDNAQQSVYLAVLEFSDMDLTNALVKAAKRGVDVRVLMDRKDTNDKYAGGLPVPTYFPNILPARELVKNHVPTRWYDARFKGQELHMKMVVVDGKKLIAGSTNFTRQAFTTFRETSVYVDGGSAPPKMVKTFMEDWVNHSTAIKKISLKDKIKAKIVEFMDKKYYAWW